MYDGLFYAEIYLFPVTEMASKAQKETIALSQPYWTIIGRQGTPIRADPEIRTFSKASCETMGQFPGVQRSGPFSWEPEKL